MKKILFIASLTLIGCLSDDYADTGFSTTSTTSSLSTETSSSSDTLIECETDYIDEGDTDSCYDVDMPFEPDAEFPLEMDPDSLLMCPMNWCAHTSCPGGSCDCISKYPPIGSLTCVYVNVDIVPTSSSGACGVGFKKMGCVADFHGFGEPPIRNQAPSECGPGFIECPEGFSPKPLEPDPNCSCPPMEGQFCAPTPSECDN